MVDVKGLADEELARRGRQALKSQLYREANHFLSEYCDRQMKQEKEIPATVLANYALAVGYCGQPREGIEICFRALSQERRNPEVYLSLARLYLLTQERKKAVEAVDRGLGISPNHRGLRQLREGMGVRHSPPLPFLPRNSTINVRLGKLMSKIESRRRPKRDRAPK